MLSNPQKRIISGIMTAVTLLGSTASSYTSLPVLAAEAPGGKTDTANVTQNGGKYVSDVFIAYGGYSIPDYESLVDEKREEIDEFINSFYPVINEYRQNYNGEGSSHGQNRAQLAHDLLNRFYDGGPD